MASLDTADRDFARAHADFAWEADRGGRIVALSAGAAAAYGRPVGASLDALLIDDPSVFAGGAPFVVETAIGPSRYRVAGLPVLDAAGVLRGYRGSATRIDRDVPRGDYLAAAARQLGTPLDAIIASAGMIGGTNLRHRDYARDIAAAARHLRGLVDRMLAVVDADGDDDGSTADLAAVAADARSLVVLRAAAKRLELGSVEARGFAVARADGRQALQILVNLFTNAVKFTPEGGSIAISVGPSRSPAMVEVAIVDSGPGIAAADRERIFSKYARAHGEDVEGSGLGLHIARELARDMGGELALEDAPRGARFVLTLPSA